MVVDWGTVVGAAVVVVAGGRRLRDPATVVAVLVLRFQPFAVTTSSEDGDEGVGAHASTRRAGTPATKTERNRFVIFMTLATGFSPENLSQPDQRAKVTSDSQIFSETRLEAPARRGSASEPGVPLADRFGMSMTFAKASRLCSITDRMISSRV